MEVWRQNRVSGAAGRRTSGSPRSRRRTRGRGERSSSPTARRPGAVRSHTKLSCVLLSGRDRPPRKEVSAPCAIRGIARRRTCILHGLKSASMRRSTRSRRGGALHEVLRERTRNFPFNHLGRREDQTGLIIRPDCGDLPYFLRSVFRIQRGGRSGTRRAGAVTAASRRSASRGGAFRSSNQRTRPIPRLRSRRYPGRCSLPGVSPRASIPEQGEHR
jgi:hypothetical protein